MVGWHEGGGGGRIDPPPVFPPCSGYCQSCQPLDSNSINSANKNKQIKAGEFGGPLIALTNVHHTNKLPTIYKKKNFSFFKINFSP